mgnify:CR=1 FL=1
MIKAKTCPGGQLAVRNNLVGLTNPTKKHYSEMSKFKIEVEFSEILPSILEMEDIDKILSHMRAIPLEKYPKFQREEDEGKSITLKLTKKILPDSTLGSAITLTIATQTGKFIIYQGMTLVEGVMEKKFREYLEKFSNRLLNF